MAATTPISTNIGCFCRTGNHHASINVRHKAITHERKSDSAATKKTYMKSSKQKKRTSSINCNRYLSQTPWTAYWITIDAQKYLYIYLLLFRAPALSQRALRSRAACLSGRVPEHHHRRSRLSRSQTGAPATVKLSWTGAGAWWQWVWHYRAGCGCVGIPWHDRWMFGRILRNFKETFVNSKIKNFKG